MVHYTLTKCKQKDLSTFEDITRILPHADNFYSASLYKLFSCRRIWHQMEQSSIRRKKLADTWPKL